MTTSKFTVVERYPLDSTGQEMKIGDIVIFYPGGNIAKGQVVNVEKKKVKYVEHQWGNRWIEPASWPMWISLLPEGRTIKMKDCRKTVMKANYIERIIPFFDFIKMYRDIVSQALVELDIKNKEVDGTNEWPNGMEWGDMVGSSHSIFLRYARETLGIDEKLYNDSLKYHIFNGGENVLEEIWEQVTGMKV